MQAREQNSESKQLMGFWLQMSAMSDCPPGVNLSAELAVFIRAATVTSTDVEMDPLGPPFLTSAFSLGSH